MSRPRLYKNLKPTSISVEADILDDLLLQGINISEVCREAMYAYTLSPDEKSKYSILKPVPPHVLNRIRSTIKGGTGEPKQWVNFLRNKYDIEVTEDFLLEYCKVIRTSL